jgi:hypothetical protein
MCGNLCVHVNVIVECIVAAGFANVRAIRFRSVLRPLRSLAGYSDVAATVLADDGHNIIRLYALGHQVGLQLDDLFFGIRVARIRLDAKKGDVISAPRRMANLTLVEVDLMVMKVCNSSPISLAFVFAVSASQSPLMRRSIHLTRPCFAVFREFTSGSMLGMPKRQGAR